MMKLFDAKLNNLESCLLVLKFSGLMLVGVKTSHAKFLWKTLSTT